MRQQPLVAGPQHAVHGVDAALGTVVGVGVGRQGNQHAEALGSVRMAGSIVQRGGIALHHHAGGNLESLDLGGIQLAVDDLVLLGQQQNEVLSAQIELAVTVELQAVQLGIAAVAEAQLEGHAAKERGADFFGILGLVQGLDAGLVDHRVGAGGLSQRLQDTLHRVTLDHAAIGTECLVKNGQNLHDDFLLNV